MDSTERVIAIVSHLVANPRTYGISEICRDLRISKSTAHRILSKLLTMQWLSREPGSKKYNIGPGLAEISWAVLSNLDLRRASLPHLSQLNQATNETAMLTLRFGFERVYVEQVEGSYEVRMITELGKRYPLWLGAQGKAILAYMESLEIEEVLENMKKTGTKLLASGQMLDADNLRLELAEIRKQGFAVSFGERVSGAAAVAAPIFDRRNQVLGAISVAGPIHRFVPEIVQRYGSMVSQAAKEIQVQLGSFGNNR
jgi:DNA-binding IclR family transcriptional regulator